MISKAAFSCSVIVLGFLLPCTAAGDLDLPDDWREVQLESNWCGAKCLWLIVKGMNKPYSLEEIKAFCPAGKERDGVLSLDDLRQAAERCGLSAMVVRRKYSWLIRKGCPAITLHRLRGSNQQDANPFANHFVVCLGADGYSVRVIEPFSPGTATLVKREVFERTWTGDALVIAQSPADLPSLHGWYVAVALTALVIAGLGVFLVSKRKRPSALAAVCILSVLPLTGCSRGKPGLQFDHLHHDFGVLWQDQFPERVKRHTFPFVNQSDAPVRITNVVGHCGCLTVDYPQEPIPPGGRGEVTLTVDLYDRLARFTTYASVFLNDDEANPIELSVSSFVVGRVKVSPERIDFGAIPAGKPTSRTLTVRIPLAPDEQQAKLEECSGKKGVFLWEVSGPRQEEAFSPGSGIHVSVYTIHVIAQPKAVGAELDDLLTVRISGRKEPLMVRIYARSTHPHLVVEPAMIHLGPIGAEPVRRKSLVRSTSERPPPITGVASSSPEVRAWLEKNPSNPVELFLWVEAKPGAQRFLEGTATLKIDDAAFPECPVPFIGYRIEASPAAAERSK
jgi:hypothetical protein